MLAVLSVLFCEIRCHFTEKIITTIDSFSATLPVCDFSDDAT